MISLCRLLSRPQSIWLWGELTAHVHVGPLPIGIMTPLALRGMPSRCYKFTSKVVPPRRNRSRCNLESWEFLRFAVPPRGIATFAHKSIVRFTSLAQQCFTAPKMRFCSDLFAKIGAALTNSSTFASPEGTTVSHCHRALLTNRLDLCIQGLFGAGKSKSMAILILALIELDVEHKL